MRDHRSVLARIEKQSLVWMAARLPRFINSDHLSALGLTAMAAAGASFALYPRSAGIAATGVVASLALNWFGDSLDGTLARVRQQQRPRYGYYVDHVIDVAGAALLFTGLAFSQIMNPLVAMALLATYLLVSSETYLATHARGVFRMAFLGIGPTELRILIAAGALKAAVAPAVTVPLAGQVALFDLGGVIAIAGMLVAFLAASISNTRALYLAEPLPGAPADVRAA
jgi:phosphatidylglycerophosphate synthase